MALDKDRIVVEAVALLDADGLDGLTLRRLADRLGVRAPTLYWHLPNKAALVTEVADAILGQEFPELDAPGADEPWQDWLVGLAERLRRAMLAHPDGARVVSSSHLSRRMAAISELAMSVLASRGVPLREARLLVLTVEHLTVGHVLSEQQPRPDTSGFDLTTFHEEHPTVVAGITEYFATNRTVDDLFRDCVQLVVSPDRGGGPGAG